MNSNDEDVRAGESKGGLPSPVESLFSGQNPTPDVSVRPPQTCSACGDDKAIQWHRLIIEWEEYMAESHGVPKPKDETLLPLCNRCRAWAELLEIAEMAIPTLSESDANQIRFERNRFLDSLNVELVRGIRVCEQLSSFSEDSA